MMRFGKTVRFLTLAIAFFALGCGSDEVIQFGAVLPETGEAAVYGHSIRRGVDLALEQIEAEGGRDITVTFVDSGSQPEQAAGAADQLLGNGALAILGGVTSAEALAMVEVADKYDRVLLSPSASSPSLTGISINFFRVFFSDFTEGVKMGNFASVKANLGSVAIVAKEQSYAKGVQDVFRQEFERQGGQVLETIEFPEGTTDFSGIAERVNTLNPQAVFVAGYAQDIANVIAALKRVNSSRRILTTHAFSSGEILAQAGSDANDVLLTLPVFDTASEEEPVKSFVTAYEAKYGEKPDVWAAHGYDAMMVLYNAIPAELRTPADFWSGMRQIENYPGVTGAILFNEKGDIGRFPRVFAVSDGGFVDYEAEVDRRLEEIKQRLEDLRRRRQQAIN